MNTDKIFSNALISVLQVVVLSGTLFYLYRFLLDTIGVEQIGVWSLVLASVSVSRIASLGLGSSTVKFVSKYLALEDKDSISKVIQTTLIAIALVLGVVLVLIFPVVKSLLSLVLAEEVVNDALAILPIALVSILLISLSEVVTGALDGFQRFDIRASIIIFCSFLYVGSCKYLVADYGLVGLAYAQVLQYAAILFLGLFSLRKLTTLPVIPHVFDRNKFREMFRYSFNFQIIGLTSMFLEPTTKGLLSLYGGVQVVGFYEMVSKLVLQLRSLIVTANQVVVPVVAQMQEKSPDKIENLYLVSMNVMILVATPLFVLLGVTLYFISEIWLGYVETIFIICGYILIISWLANTLIAPAFFAYLGTGHLKINVISHIVTAVFNLILGWLFGSIYGWIGVVIGWAVASIIGSFIIVAGYHYENSIRYKLVMNSHNSLLISLGVVTIIAGYFINHYSVLNHSPLVNYSAYIAIPLLLMAVLMVRNPTFFLLKNWIMKKDR